VNYHSEHLLASNLVGSGIDRVAEVVVVDNSTIDRHRAGMRELAHRESWTLVDAGGNIGFGAAANRGADLAIENGAEVVVFLNPDARLDVANLQILIASLDNNSICAPRIVDAGGAIWFEGGALNVRRGTVSHRPGAHDWFTGACLALRSEIWTRLGGFDERFFLYWEDVDLSRRCIEAGGQLRLVRDAVAVHEAGGTQPGEGGKSALYVRFNSRNRLLFVRKHYSKAAALRALPFSLSYGYRLYRRARPHGVRQTLSVLAALLQGTLSGIAAVLWCSDGRQSISVGG
jgi:GT2 family glycosyltransferase